MASSHHAVMIYFRAFRSGMLEQGVDRIVAQVVDPKIHHIFRPQVEKVVRQFLSPGSHVDEPSVYYSPGEERQDLSLPQSGKLNLSD